MKATSEFNTDVIVNIPHDIREKDDFFEYMRNHFHMNNMQQLERTWLLYIYQGRELNETKLKDFVFHVLLEDYNNRLVTQDRFHQLKRLLRFEIHWQQYFYFMQGSNEISRTMLTLVEGESCYSNNIASYDWNTPYFTAFAEALVNNSDIDYSQHTWIRVHEEIDSIHRILEIIQGVA